MWTPEFIDLIVVLLIITTYFLCSSRHVNMFKHRLRLLMNTSLSWVEKHRPVAVRCDKPVNSCLHVVFKQESGVNRSSDDVASLRNYLSRLTPPFIVSMLQHQQRVSHYSMSGCKRPFMVYLAALSYSTASLHNNSSTLALRLIHTTHAWQPKWSPLMLTLS